jgi:dTDP-4-dehydrorhamnose 3,5-epimerase
MRFQSVGVPGAWTVDPEPYVDERGRFMRAWCADEFAAHGIHFVPVQANMGHSHRAGTLRGLHYQLAPHLEAKLVRCTKGAVFDVLVDLRPESPTYGSWFGTELTADNGRMLYVPPMCAHGYQTLRDDSEILYMASASFARDASRGLRFDDPTVAIRWPLPPVAMSEQDTQWPHLDREAIRNP